MKPYGYDVLICYSMCAGADAPRVVSGAQIPRQGTIGIQNPPNPKGPVDFGVTSVQNMVFAYRGTHGYKGDGPRTNLRLLANIQAPNYMIVAVKADSGITSLTQVKEKRWPVRILTDGNEVSTPVLEYYGLTKETVETPGGKVMRDSAASRKDFDIIIHGGTLGNAPEFNVWYEVSQTNALTYLQLPEDLLAKLAKDDDMELRNIPDGLLRGIDHPIPTVARTGHAVYGRADMPDNFAYAVARALDEHMDLLQWSHLPLSYNPHTVWKAFDMPLHPGAARYYRERKYMN